MFAGRFRQRRYERLGTALADRITAGGYPAAIMRASPKRRAAWYRNYIETPVQRDIRDLARISALDSMPRLLQFAGGQTARLLNAAEIASAFQLSRPTIRDYMVILERIFLLERLPPWHSNRLSRLVKTPKLHLGDTGLAAGLLGLDSAGLIKDRAMLGQLLETFVFQELRRQASWHDRPVHFYHFRDKDGVEVDMVLEQAGKVAGIEVKTAATVREKDFNGLRKLRATSQERFAAGIVLYDGETIAGFGEDLYAVPICAIWETP